LYGISQGKGFGFVVSPARAVIAAGPEDLLQAVVQDYKSTGSMSILRSTVELYVDMRARGESSPDW
jgi:hypothetical protein